MNEPDDFDLRARLSQVFDDEPPMVSGPTADLERGRRRRRRRHNTVATAVVVPALMIGAWAVAGGTPGNSESSPVDTVQPAEPSETEEEAIEVPADCTLIESGEAEAGRPGGNDAHTAPRSSGEETTCDPLACARATTQSETDDTLTWDCSELGEDDYTLTDEVTTRLTDALRRHLDPSGEHLDQSMSSGSATMARGGELTGTGVGSDWIDGSQAGYVGVSVSSDHEEPGCLDPNLMNGPDVDCHQRTLDDGTVVHVGRGSEDGAERVAVRFERPDGTIVWVTADEATAQWWDDSSGAQPLTSLPVAVDDLIELALDGDLHL